MKDWRESRNKVPFEDGTLVTAGYVQINGTKHEIIQPEYTGKTPLSAYNLNKMQDNIESAVKEGDLINKINIYGASKQETREGYNKFNLEKWFNNAVASSCTKTLLRNGVKLDFTAGADAFIGHIGSAGSVLAESVRECLTEAEASKEYTLSLSSVQKCYIGYYDENYTSLGYIVLNSIKTTFTTPANTKYISLRLGIQDSNYTTYSFTDIQIVEGAEEKPYEQYGVSPSIEYEAPIESVGEIINIFDIDNPNMVYQNSTSYEKIPNGLRIKNTVASTANTFAVFKILDVSNMVGKKLTIKGEWKTSGNNKGQMVVGLCDENGGNRQAGLFMATSGQEETYTVPEITTSKYLAIWLYSNLTGATAVEGDYIDYAKIKISEGATTGIYSPYGQGSIEIINSNKNLLDLGNDTFVSNGLNITNKISKITVNGTLTSSWATGSKSKSCLLKAGTYTFSIDNPLTHHIYLNFTFEDNTTRTLQINRNTLSNKITTDKNIIKYNVGFSGVTSGTTYNEVIYLQLEKGETATDYVEHQSQTKALYTQQPLRAIGDVKDRFIKKDGIWYEEHKIGRYIFTGNENWMKNDDWTNQNAFFGTINWNPKLVDGFVTIASLICSHLPIVSPHKVSVMEGSGIGQGAGKSIYISMEGIITSAVLKAKLTELYNTGTPLYVDYVLETPTLIECTPEQVEVLNDIYSAYGEGLTNITCTDEIEPIIEITKATRETVQSENDKAISALIERVLQLEETIKLIQNISVEEES